MTVGIKDTLLAHKWLTVISGTTFTATANSYAQMHTADPTATGIVGAINGTVAGDRKVLAWGAPAGGSMAAVATFPSWAVWDGGSVTLTHVSVWDAAGAGAGAAAYDTGGNFYFDAALSSGKPITNGDTFNLTALSIGLSPIAA